MARTELETIAELREQLTRADARIAELERLRTDVLDRIDWALDSLNTLLDETDTEAGAR